jgi:Ca2+-binding EF-hand superfamily protein
LQISPDELRNAMSFLKEQLGEEELRGMLETLNAEARGDGGIDVAKLMDLAHGEDGDKSD